LTLTGAFPNVGEGEVLKKDGEVKLNWVDTNATKLAGMRKDWGGLEKSRKKRWKKL